MAKRKKSSGLEGIAVLGLVVIGFVLKYWEFFLGVGIVGGVIYLMFKSAKQAGINSSSQETLTPEDVRVLFKVKVTSDCNFKRGAKESLKFYEQEETVTVGGITFPAYLLYIGESENRYPHLINPSYSVAKTSPNYSVNMGYWPSYHSITATDRSAYLSWLQTGRCNPEANIGLVFLFFYGLEYRAVEERKNYLEILNELIRLYKIYAEKNGSFATYCSKLIAWIIYNIESIDTPLLNTLADMKFRNTDVQHAVISTGTSISPEKNRSKFLIWYAQSKLSLQISRSMESIRDEFESKFLKKLELVDIKDNDFVSTGKQIISYHSATALRLDPSKEIVTKALPSNLDSKILSAWIASETELNSYSKLLKDHSKLSSLYAVANKAPNEKLFQFLSFQEEKICKIRDILTTIENTEIEKLSPTESKRIAEGLETFQIHIEPDPRYSPKAFKLDDSVVLSKDNLTVSDAEKWARVIPLFDLSLSIAISEGQADDQEVKHVIDFVSKQFKLTPSEISRLRVRVTLLKETKISIAPLAKKIASSMSLNQGQSIAKFLFSIAALDGKLESTEIKALEKTYKAFNFPEDTIDRMIAEFTNQQNGSLVVLKEKTKSQKKGSSIPKQSEEQKTPNTITLDTRVLENAFAEASEVSKILSSVFNNEDEAVLVEKVDLTHVKTTKNELRDVESSILDALLQKEFWDLGEVEDLCRSKGVMYGAFLNTVNQWAELKFGMPILEEDGDTLTISRKHLGEAESA